MKFGKSPLIPIAALVAAIVSIQIGAALSKGLFAAVGAEGATAFRFGISALILSVVFKPWKLSVNSSNWKILLLYGASMCGACLFFYKSLETIPLGIASAIEFGGPIAVAFLSSRRISDFVWIALAVFGLFLLMPVTTNTSTLDTAGIVYAVIAAICWGVYIISGQKAGAEHGFRTTVLGVLIATAIVLPVGFFEAGYAMFDLSLLPLGVAIAVLTSAIPFTLEMVALQRISAQAFGTLLSLEPAIASLVGFSFLREELTLLQCFAIALIVAASIGITLSTSARRKDAVVAK